MYCSKCGCQINDRTVFCPQCGTRVANDTTRDPEPVNRMQSAVPYNSYSSAYGVGMPYSSVPAIIDEKQPLISKGGYIATVILSAVAVTLYFLGIIAKYFLFHSWLIFTYSNLIDLVLVLIPFLIFCLLLKTKNAFFTALPLFIIVIERTILFSLFNNYFYYTPDEWIVSLIFSVGIVLYFITLMLKSRPIALKIITTVILGIYMIGIIFINSPMAQVTSVTSICFCLSNICLAVAMIVILYTTKPKNN